MGWTSTDEENEKLKQAREKISKLKLKIDDQPGLNIDKILARSERINQSTKLGLIVIDYMQLITTSLKGTTNDKVSDISHKIKDLSRFCNVPVIALSQLSRGIEARTIKTPLLSDLRDSGSLEQDADTVIFLYRDEEEIIYDDRPSIRNLSVAKQRNGATGISSLLFHQKKMRFTDL